MSKVKKLARHLFLRSGNELLLQIYLDGSALTALVDTERYSYLFLEKMARLHLLRQLSCTYCFVTEKLVLSCIVLRLIVTKLLLCLTKLQRWRLHLLNYQAEELC